MAYVNKKSRKRWKLISQRLQQVLDRKGWSQSQLATEIHTHAATVNRWLRGKIPPSRKALARVAEATGCDLDWLETGNGAMFHESSPYYPYASKEEMVSDLRDIEAAAGEMQEAESESLGWDEEEEDRRRARRQKISSLLTKTAVVLESTTIHCGALAATIDALYRAVKLEEKFIPKRGLMALKEKGLGRK